MHQRLRHRRRPHSYGVLTMKQALLLLVLILLPALIACSFDTDQSKGVSSFDVSIVQGRQGSPGEPAPFPEEPVRYVLNVRALNHEGKLLRSFEGKVAISVEPAGRLAEGQARRFEIENGIAENLEIWLERCHGEITIWVEDAGGLDAKGTYALGASPILYFAYPTIAQLQRCDDFESSALNGDFAELRIADRLVMVTNIQRDGFYCQDLAEPGGEYGGVYVYTHNWPGDLVEGDRLATLRGQVSEFFGFTELSFPDYQVAGENEPVDVPAALIEPAWLTEDDQMESLESSMVKVQNVTVCPMDEQYYLYDQWRVLVNPGGSCEDETATINVGETGRFDDIDPPSLVGSQLTEVTGTLRYHYLAAPSWIIVPRNAQDVQ